MKRAKRLLVVCGTITLGCGSSDLAQNSNTPTAATTAALSGPAPAPTREVAVEIDIPSGRSLSELGVVGAELQIDAAAQLTTAAGRLAGVAHTGADALRIGRDVRVGAVLSVGDVAVGDGVHVYGDLRTAGIVSAPPPVLYTVDGKIAQGEAIPLRKLTRRVGFGATAQGIRVAPGAETPTSIAPGAYAALDVGPRSEIVLRAGNYYFDELTFNDGAKLTIDDRDGAVFVYVGSELRLGGSIARAVAGHPRFLLSYLGSNPVVLSRPFVGGLVAPNASIEMTATTVPHQGSFYGKSVHVHANARVVHRAMPWVIGSVTFDKTPACAGDSVRIKVDATDPTNPAARATVAIDSAPVDQMYDQVLGAPGQKLYAVSAVAADGTRESQIARLPVVACASGQPIRPTLVAAPNPLVPESVAFTITNAPDLGDVTYQWNFGDGTVMNGPSPAVSHSFVDAVPSGSERGAFDVTVTVKRAGAADVAATRTFVVWSSYEMSRARGMLEPPTTPVDSLLKQSGSSFAGDIDFTNRELDTLTYDRRRVDLLPCDGDAPITYGGDESVSVAVPPKGTLRVPLTVPTTSFTDTTCGAVVHHFGATASGLKAHVAVQFDLPSKPGKGTPVDPTTAAVLNLYRARQIPKDATKLVPLSDMREPPQPCDPEDPGKPPQPGFTCQPTGKWEGPENPGAALGHHIENAYKGDAVLVRACGGPITSLLGALDPPQLFTHTGMMTKHRFEIAHSTGSVDYLVENHNNGVSGQPTDGFEEDALRYLWPGTVVASVEEAFGKGTLFVTPKGTKYNVSGFRRDEVRCTGDSQIVFPRVLKPSPARETETRPKLMAAADAAKGIHGHYRFASYSNAPDLPTADPKGPALIANASPLAPTYGPSPTVCSSFIRFSLKQAGFQLDGNKLLPRPSDPRGSGAPDGLFFYDAAERKDAANLLYAGLYNMVEHDLALLSAKTDEYWWASAGAIASGSSPDWSWPAMGNLFLLGLPATGNTDTLVMWATDAPDDVASQVTNCFASDDCSEDAKDSDAWEEPGDGIAVSPDDMLNHFDPPELGGPYGYSERMIYRGADYKPVYEWRPAEGSFAIPVRVVMYDGPAVELASVTIPGFRNEPVTTDSAGKVLIEGVPGGNIRIHAWKVFAEPAPGKYNEGDACFVTEGRNLFSVDCKDYSKKLSETPVTEAVVTLQPPREEFRKVIISAKPRLEDCDCGSENDVANPPLDEICHVSRFHRDDSVSKGTKELCSDEIGVSFEANCHLEEDNRTVRVTGKFTLYESVANSCGGDSWEDEQSFDVKVGPLVVNKPYLKVLYNWDVCGLSACNDTAEIKEFTITNAVDE